MTRRAPRGTRAPFGKRWARLVSESDDWSEEHRAGPAAFDSTLLPTPAPRLPGEKPIPASK